MTTQRRHIYLFGDSLTQTSFEGWGGYISHVYQRRADVFNRGYSGYNTNFFLQLPPDNIPTQSLVILFFGANDAALAEQDAHHHVPVDQFSNNLRALVQRIRDATGNDCSILLLTPPPVQHDQRLAYQKARYKEKATGVLERTLENTGKYAAACQSLAKELDLPCLDLYHKMQESDSNWGKYFCDGLHFSSEGQKFVGEAVISAINEHYPSWKVHADPRTGSWASSASECEGLNAFGPYHDEIDSNNVESSMKKHFDPKET